MKARISRPLSVLSLGAAVALALATANPGRAHEAGEAGHAAHHAAMEKMRSMMHELAEHADERLAALKTELKITDAQLPQWNGFSSAVLAAAKWVVSEHDGAAHAGAKPGLIYGGERSYPDAGAIKKTGAAPAEDAAAPSAPAEADASEALPARLEAHEKRMAEHLAKMQAIKSALDPLYASFSDEQKKIADGLKVGPFGVM